MAQLTVKQIFQIAVQHHQEGKLAQAERLYRQIIVRQPNHAEALHFLGLIAAQVGRNDTAVDLIGQAIAARPDYPQAWSNLGIALRATGKLDEAIAAFRRAIALDPGLSEAQCNLGSAMKDKGDLDEAISAYRRAIALSPGDPQAHSNLGNALTDKGQFEEAIAACRTAIELDPNIAQAHDNLGCALQAQGQLDEAMAAYRRAIVLNHKFAPAHHNLASVLLADGQYEEAIAANDQAILLEPNYAEAHWNLALALLSRGEFERGWQEYEWRWQCKAFTHLRRNFSQPQWDGRPLAGATILVHAEQGFGDTLQFIRYLPLVKRRGGKIVIECQPELRSLLQIIAGDQLVVAKGEPLPPFDVHAPLLTLPRLFATTLDNIPQLVPYLHTDPAQTRTWQERLAGNADHLKVGLVWAGRREHRNDRNRSISLSALASLGQLQGVRFYSLQKGEPAREAKNPPAGLDLIDWTADLHDFTDTAAFIANLDLVISVDTSVAHLAGGLGKPVWVMLPFVADWRWMLQREDSPWYPTMRLFRQPAIGDWESVIKRVSENLSNLVPRRRNSSGPLSPVPGGEGSG